MHQLLLLLLLLHQGPSVRVDANLSLEARVLGGGLLGLAPLTRLPFLDLLLQLLLVPPRRVRALPVLPIVVHARQAAPHAVAPCGGGAAARDGLLRRRHRSGDAAKRDHRPRPRALDQVVDHRRGGRTLGAFEQLSASNRRAAGGDLLELVHLRDDLAVGAAERLATAAAHRAPRRDLHLRLLTPLALRLLCALNVLSALLLAHLRLKVLLVGVRVGLALPPLLLVLLRIERSPHGKPACTKGDGAESGRANRA